MTDQLVELAASLFAQAGGPDWRTDLLMGGLTACAALSVSVALLLAWIVLRRDER